ncbi:unnamed protein product [Gongylonema pulchrum]|uniref:GRIP domain-containing protein n=1 Tax=Gongylonema pulchrum TaxID=637853 RepID=A0A183CW21_9BILA|nr:unnamed protein product [Gongylonema pulchrum]
MGKLRYLLQQKDEQLVQKSKEEAEQQSRISEFEKQFKHCTDENAELRTQLHNCAESLKQHQENRTKEAEEVKSLEKENMRLQKEYSAALNEIQRLKDDIRPAVKTDLERRFEEYRYRLSCALQTVHEYEDEVSKLRSRVAELESERRDRRSGNDKELEQLHEYTGQLEEQFTAQVGIIEALKRRIVQQKTLADFLSSMAENGELSLSKIEDKLARFRLSQQDEGNCQLMDAVQKLLRFISTNYGYGYKVLPTALS